MVHGLQDFHRLAGGRGRCTRAHSPGFTKHGRRVVLLPSRNMKQVKLSEGLQPEPTLEQIWPGQSRLMDAVTGKVGHSDGEPAHELLGLHKHCIFNAQGIYTRMQQKLAQLQEAFPRARQERATSGPAVQSS